MDFKEFERRVNRREFNGLDAVVAAAAREGCRVSGFTFLPLSGRDKSEYARQAVEAELQRRHSAREFKNYDALLAAATKRGYYVAGMELESLPAPQAQPPQVVVHVHPSITVTPPEVVVNVPKQPAPEVVVNVQPEPKPKRIEVERNRDGSIKSLRTVEEKVGR